MELPWKKEGNLTGGSYTQDAGMRTTAGHVNVNKRGQEEGTVDGRTVRASMGGDRRSLSSNSNRNNGPRMSDVGCRVCGDS